jgi:hypothetical protein
MLNKMKIGVSPITKSIYLHSSKSDDNINTSKRNFEGEVMRAITDRLLLEEDRTVKFSFGDKKFALTLKEIKA